MATQAVAADSVLYLTFRIEQELLAFEVARVREVLDLCPITRVPRTPEYMRGVINLRGSVIPVLDLRLKFGLPKTATTIDARIVVIEIHYEGEMVLVGILTDSVHDVIEIDSEHINSSPQMGARWRTEYVSGIGKFNDQFILLLDLDRVFSSKDAGSLSEG
ncbi:MAG TPA: chemotaxis protein CheW [Desulfobulbaceae bacterium]|nr:chemotaxis protein CheW [Desulfobulbaceae bacterium]